MCIRDRKESINLNNVSFGYNDRMILEEINLQIKKGETIAFVGGSGSGKTSLIGLLCGFFEINKGQILLDGVSINRFSKSGYRQLFGLVTHCLLYTSDAADERYSVDTGGRRIIKKKTNIHTADATINIHTEHIEQV